MSDRAVQTLLITALTDRQRRDALLQGCPTAYEGFDLSDDEIRTLMTIHVDTLAAFAEQAHWFLYQEPVLHVDDRSSDSYCAWQPESNCA
jgi:hypothetical protein